MQVAVSSRHPFLFFFFKTWLMSTSRTVVAAAVAAASTRCDTHILLIVLCSFTCCCWLSRRSRSDRSPPPSQQSNSNNTLIDGDAWIVIFRFDFLVFPPSVTAAADRYKRSVHQLFLVMMDSSSSNQDPNSPFFLLLLLLLLLFLYLIRCKRSSWSSRSHAHSCLIFNSCRARRPAWWLPGNAALLDASCMCTYRTLWCQ